MKYMYNINISGKWKFKVIIGLYVQLSTAYT